MIPTLSAPAQTLYDAINQKTIQNSYYDDERHNPVKTPDLNKAYSCIQALLETPQILAQVLQEKTHPPSIPEIQTPMATYLKIALAGDFDQQLAQESDHQKNLDTLTKLAQVSQQHPELLTEELWEQETPIFIVGKKGTLKMEKFTGPDPLEDLPINLSNKIREEAWSVCWVAEKPLLAIACRRLFASAQDWRWSDTPHPRDIEQLKTLAQTLDRLPSFAHHLEETLGTDSEPRDIDAYQKTLEEYAKKTLIKTQGIPEFIAQKEIPHNIRTHLLTHYLTGKTRLLPLQTILQKEKDKLLERLKQTIKKQDHLPV